VQASVPTASRTSVHTSSNTSVWESEEALAPLVTKEQKWESLKMWKDLMSTTDDYKPSQHRSELAHLKEIKFLKTAMGDFRGMKLKGLAALKSEHDNYRTVQSRYYIPREFCMPEQFFREVQFDRNVLYWKRCCSMVDFYNLCCKDTPFSKEKRRPDRREAQNIEPKAVDAKALIWVGNVGAIEEVKSSYRPARSTQQPQRQESAMQSQRQATFLILSSNPSGLDEEQIESAEKAEIRRRAPKRTTPIPEEDDSTNTDGETNRLFKSRLLPDQKAKISQFVKDIRRIKQKNYTPGCVKDKESNIEAAEKDRKAGLLGPAYLAGAKSPWDAYLGHASVHYD
jgi:hypothetical protein